MLKKANHNGNIKSRVRILFLCFIFLFAVLTNCNNNDKASEDQSDNGTDGNTITSDGGTVSDPDGASVVIPPGALSGPVDISIITYKDNSSLPGTWCPIPSMAGAADFGPDGLEFQIPVTITIPTSIAMTPDEQFPLLYWDSENNKWVQTEFTAKVNADGMSFSAEITHFSGYGGGAFQNFANGGSAGNFMNDFINWFENANIKNIGDKSAKNNECWEVVGIDFDLQYEISGKSGEEFKRIGRSTDNPDAPLNMVDFTYDISNGQSYSAYIRMTVTAYNDCTAPDLIIEADPLSLPEGDTSTVTAKLDCAGTPMTGKEIQFEVSSGPGDINPGNAETSSGGQADATFTATENGKANVTATHEACQNDSPKTVTEEITINIIPQNFILEISYVQIMDIPCITYDTIEYSGSVSISVTGIDQNGSGILTGQGTLPFSGLIHHYDSDDCSIECESTKTGTLEYNVSGTLTVPDTGNPELELIMSPNFDTTMTTVCPDATFTQPYMVGGEPFSFTIPAEDGYTIDHEETISEVSTHITYILYILD